LSEKLLLRKKLGMPESTTIIISHRGIAPVYRSEIVLRAFQQAQMKRNDMRLVMLEGGSATKQVQSYRLRIKDMASRLGKSVKLVKGAIAPVAMSAYLKSADVIVGVPVTDQRSTSTLEALACCSSVILSNVPAFAELREEGYRFRMVHEVSESSLCKSFVQACCDSREEKQSALLHNAALIREREDFEKQAIKIEEEYYRVLDSKGQTGLPTSRLST
jgi:glycosyltransferase involved in cell wall biosynthesis